MRLYLASGLQNRATVAQIAQGLRDLGHTITYDWTEHGSVQDASDEEKAAVAQAELEGVLAAEMVVVILPGGRGTHVEIGAALGVGIPVVIVYRKPEDLLVGGVECVFYDHPGVMTHPITSDFPPQEWLAAWIHCAAGPYAEYLVERIVEAKEMEDPKWNEASQDVARAVRDTALQHLSAAKKSTGSKGDNG